MASEKRVSAKTPQPHPDTNLNGDGARRLSPSIIGSGLVMKGELTLDEDLIIEGTFDGTIVHRGQDKLVVRRVARLSGEISGDNLQIENGTNLEDTILSGRIRLATKSA